MSVLSSTALGTKDTLNSWVESLPSLGVHLTHKQKPTPLKFIHTEHCECSTCSELYILKRSIVYYVNFTSIKKENKRVMEKVPALTFLYFPLSQKGKGSPALI